MRRMNKEVKKYLAKLGRKGAKATNSKLSPKQRSESARRAALARWHKPVETQA
jgi:hypothetical protein